MTTWFEDHRIEWIAEMIRVYGFINRAHLVRMFGISVPQASHDIQEFQRRYPNIVSYDRTNKRYVSVYRIAPGDNGERHPFDDAAPVPNRGTKDTAVAEWSCGHVAGFHCAQCYQELAQRAHELAEQLQDTLDTPELTVRIKAG